VNQTEPLSLMEQNFEIMARHRKEYEDALEKRGYPCKNKLTIPGLQLLLIATAPHNLVLAPIEIRGDMLKMIGWAEEQIAKAGV